MKVLIIAAASLIMAVPSVALAEDFWLTSSSASMLYEFTSDGTLLHSIPVPYPGNRNHVEEIRGCTVLPTGDVAVYNGTYSPYLSTYHLATGTWSNQTFAGWDSWAGLLGVGQSHVAGFITSLRLRDGVRVVRFCDA